MYNNAFVKAFQLTDLLSPLANQVCCRTRTLELQVRGRRDVVDI